MEQEMKVSPEQTVEVVDIQFRPGQKIYYFDPNGLAFQTGDHVIIDTARGAEYGICAGCNHKIAQKDVVAPLRKVLRKATAQDEKIAADNRAKEKRAYDVCLDKIAAHRAHNRALFLACQTAQFINLPLVAAVEGIIFAYYTKYPHGSPLKAVTKELRFVKFTCLCKKSCYNIFCIELYIRSI